MPESETCGEARAELPAESRLRRNREAYGCAIIHLMSEFDAARQAVCAGNTQPWSHPGDWERLEAVGKAIAAMARAALKAELQRG